jgi:serine/threonine-protein kinase HipA
MLENLRSRAVQEAEALYGEIESENAQIIDAHPELSATMAGESRCLRAVVHTIIKEMTRQIA